MTYYEHFEVFLKILNLFRDILKYERMAATKIPYSTFAEKIITEIDCCADIRDNTVHIEPLLAHLHDLSMENPPSQITVAPQGYQKFVYPLVKPSEIRKSCANFFCPFLFTMLSLDNFYELLCRVYLEQTVIFVSENLNVLTSSL